jgi:hypothetical protein
MRSKENLVQEPGVQHDGVETWERIDRSGVKMSGAKDGI